MDPDDAARLRQLQSLAGARTWPWGLSPTERALLRKRLRSLSSDEQIALLRSCVALMPQFRERDSYRDGSLLYEAAVLLYGMKLPVSEADLCQLLRTASHTCGHGEDVRPPVELAQDYMRREGYSPTIMAAIEDFRDALPPARPAKVHNIRRAIDLLAVLRSAKPKRGLRPWTADVADHLAELPAEELRRWQQLVLGMVVREQHRMPATWERVATAFIDEVGTGLVATRLQEFWPARHAEVSLKQGGAQLLKHFLWMLSLLPDRPAGDELASRIPTMTWRRQQDPPIGILKAAAAYLEPSISPAARSARALLLQQISAAGR